jgi:hypothetical protein
MKQSQHHVDQRTKRPNGVTIYGKQVETGELFTWTSKEAWTLAITGKPFANKATMDLRLDKGISYKGCLLQTTPF